MEPTLTEITIFATHVELDEPILVYRNIVLSVPNVGDKVYYKYKKRRYSQTVTEISWEYSADKPYVRARVQLRL